LPEVRNLKKKTYKPNRLGKLEALKFRMEMQNRNLQMLTQHNSLMSNIHDEDATQKKASHLKRENNVFQNQQIIRIERDLERTSKQLQSEIESL